MSDIKEIQQLVNTMVSMHNAIGEAYTKLFTGTIHSAAAALASKVQSQSSEILQLKEALNQLPTSSPFAPLPSSADPPKPSLKRKTPSQPLFPAGSNQEGTEFDGFVFVKKPKLTKSEETEAQNKPKSPKRRDHISREERKKLPGYASPGSEPFYKAFGDVYDEQELKDKLSEHRYEFPPAKDRPEYFNLDV